MQLYEYRVVPAPAQGEKARGAHTTEARMAVALANIINAEARGGWEYVRTDTLPAEERSGLSKRRQVFVSLLVFRRASEAAVEAQEPAPAPKSFFRLGRLTGRPATETPSPAPRILLPSEGVAPRLGPASAETPPSPDKIGPANQEKQ